MSDASINHVVHADTPDPRRWFALVVIGIAQLMVILDASIVNIALPHAALPKALGGLAIAQKNYQWAITAYTLTFGGFLLLGGRIGDYMGRKRSFLIGLLGFAGASLLGGFAQNQQWLFGARALQGLFGALLAPAALSLISVTFTDSKERAKAFAVYGALSGVGGAIGLIAGGLLTQYLSWRWCLFVNTPMAILAFTLAVPNVRESKVEGHPHYDVPGALTATAGMLSVVFGVSQASTDGWGSTSAWPYLVLGAFLLLVFFVIERRIKEPLLPLRLITDRVRAGAFLAQLFVGLGLFGMFLFMTFYFQYVEQYSAVKTGLLFMPFSFGIILAAGMTSQWLPKFGPRPLATIGNLMAAAGLALPLLYQGRQLVRLERHAGHDRHQSGTGSRLRVDRLDGALQCASRRHRGRLGRADDVPADRRFFRHGHCQHHRGLQWHRLHGGGVERSHPVTTARAKLLLIATSHVHGYDESFRFGALMLFIAAILFFALVNIDRDHLGQHDEAATEVYPAST